MSIRLRLTLLYTAILALTLMGFSATLYGSQAQAILAREKQLLADMARRSIERPLRSEQQLDDIQSPPWPLRDAGAPDRRFGVPTLYVQLVSLEGQVTDRSENLDEVVLPLSGAGWQAVRSGKSWVERASVAGERLLIYSTPVIVGDQIAEVMQVARPLGDQEQHLSTLGRNLLIGSGAATIIAFGAGWVLSGLVLRPVHRITQTAQAIGAERDLSRRVHYTGPNDELGQLATTFNAMLAELEAAYQQQQQFVADVSHELRTPLTTLRGNLGLLRREPAISPEDRAEVLDDMVGESERLIRLVNDLLALARADARRALRSEPVWVRPLVEDACHQAHLIEPGRSIAWGPLPHMAVLGDPDALKQVLLILMDNALKHTTGAITVTAEVGDEDVAMSVHDDGPGIAPEMFPHIFERFHCGQSASGESSIGLGLAIAKALVDAQGGRITVESQIGQGSTFTVSLPRAAHSRHEDLQ